MAQGGMDASENTALVQKILKFPMLDHPIMPTATEEQRLQMIENIGPKETMRLLMVRDQRIKAELNDPLRYGTELESWKEADTSLCKFNELLVLGGNRCLAPEQTIFDPVANKERVVSEIKTPFHVYAWDGANMVIAEAETPFRKPEGQRVYEIQLKDGSSFRASGAHRVLAASGEYVPLDSLLPGSLLFPIQSNSGTFLSRCLASVLRLRKTALDFLGDYLERFRLYDEQLRQVKGNGPSEPPSQDDALRRNVSSESICRCVSGQGQRLLECNSGDLACKCQHNHLSWKSCHHSTQDDLRQPSGQSADTLYRETCRTSVSASSVFQGFLQWLVVSCLQLSKCGFVLLGKCIAFSSGRTVSKKIYLRNDFVWDFTVPKYHNYMIAGVIHHNSSKTEWAAKRMAQAFTGYDMGNMPDWIREKHQQRGIRIWCLHTTHMTSVSMQQTVFYKYLPQELKEAKRSKHCQISFSQKNGFTDNTAVYQHNQIWFLNYSQDIKIVEGGEVDYVWCDELVPQDWLETLRYRLVTRNGKLLITFTPILGYTQTVKEYVATSKITKTKEAELLPGNNVLGAPAGHMPFTAEGVHGRHGVVWYHSKLNPYNNWERMKQTLRGRSSHDIKIRAYGWADQTAGSQFPLFNDEHNVFSQKVTDHVPEGEGTNYMVCDPAGARNWFMLWARVDEHGILWVYREWPDQSYGEWALPGDKPDGKPGPAQRAGAGKGVNEYTLLIHSLENHKDTQEEIAERYIDPRTAGSEMITKEGGTTLPDLLAEAENPLYFTPSAAVTVDERVLLINDLLCWDRTQPKMKGVNHPKIMVHESCQNLIWSLKEWTGTDGQKGACKDPIDCLGYMVVMSPVHVGGAAWKKHWASAEKCGSY